MDFILQRFSDNRDSTLGLFLKVLQDNKGKRTVFQGYILEDQFQEKKVMHETRIPADRYELVLQTLVTPLTLKYRAKYPWFDLHIMLKDVPGFTGVYMHIGNTDEDTDACLLIGDAADNNVIAPGTITNSTAAFKRFYTEILQVLKRGERCFIDVRDEKYLLSA